MESSYFICKKKYLFRRWFSTEVKCYFPDTFLKEQLQIRLIKCSGFNSVWKYIRNSKLNQNDFTNHKSRKSKELKVKMRITMKALCAGLPANMMKETKFQMQFNLPQLTISIHHDHERREHYPFTYTVITNNFRLH